MAFFLALLSHVEMGTMADFPPNPEDGELWLPSDVFHEIVSATIKPERSNSHQAFVKNAALDHVAIQRKSSAAARSLSEAVSKFQVLHFFLSALFSNSVVQFALKPYD